MKIDTVWAVYFSATDTTKKVVTYIAQETGRLLETEVRTIDFTLPAAREHPLSFHKSDLVIFGVPVYAGRVPNVLLPFIKEKTKGNGSLAVPVVLYGNRNFDDALIELRDLLYGSGFAPIAAGAFIGEHSFSRILGANRPDERDMRVAKSLAELTFQRARELHKTPEEPVAVKGETPLRPYYTPRDRNGVPVNILKVKPKTNEDCTGCQICAALCPMGSIDFEDPSQYNGICIKCGACIKKCPENARYYDDEAYLYHQHELEEEFIRRAEPEIF